MSVGRRLRAPSANGAVLADPGFDRLPERIEGNRRKLDRPDVAVGGLPLPELRALARREYLALADDWMSGDGREPVPAVPRSADAPLVMAGHQPELSHPGVWVKHFALNGLARRVGGVPLNLVVDNDTLKSTAVKLPAVDPADPAAARLEAVPFDRFDGEQPYEERAVRDPDLFRTFADRAAPIWRDWGFEPLLPAVWPGVVGHPAGTVGGKFAAVRRKWERAWGCHNLELGVSSMAPTEPFARFAGHLLCDLPRFHDVYNAAIRRYRAANGIRSKNHPAPELTRDGVWYEAPFWAWKAGAGRRGRVWARTEGDILHLRPEGLDASKWPADAGRLAAAWREHSGHGVAVRPRALTLTLFARLGVGDFFIHGIGGGKYDEVTDALIRGYFGVDPPAYQVLTATVRLPLPGFPRAAAEVAALARTERDVYWNPHRHTADPSAAARIAALVAAEPTDRAGRRRWFRRLRQVRDELRPLAAEAAKAVRAERSAAERRAAADAAVRRRDFPWVLHPEHTLRPFLQQFL